jgi:hypothetical protein
LHLELAISLPVSAAQNIIEERADDQHRRYAHAAPDQILPEKQRTGTMAQANSSTLSATIPSVRNGFRFAEPA